MKRITYVQPGDPEAWIDWPRARDRAPNYVGDNAVKCSICRGHGGWNLLLGAYPLARENTSENRHLFSHMKATCHGCGGHGWLRPNSDCVHELRYNGVSGKITHLSCVHCKKTVSWDTRGLR